MGQKGHNMEKMTDKELEQFKKLQAKRKRIQREQEAFKKQVIANREEVLHILGVDKAIESYHATRLLEELGKKYGMTVNQFLDVMGDEFVVETFVKWLNQYRTRQQ